MITVIQLLYVHSGKERVLHEFEEIAIPLIAKYGGELLLRLRPQQDSVVAASIEAPYEIHVVRFQSEQDLQRFAADEERQRFLHLKNESVRSALVFNAVGTP